MSLTKAERADRAREALTQLRHAWHRARPITVTVQEGRRRPRTSGRVVFVATTGAFALLNDGGDDPIHVPVDAVVRVDFT